MNIVITVVFSFLMAMSCGTQKPTTTTGLNQDKDTYPVKEYTKSQNLETYEVAIFAGGCFWCTEASFERIEGVVDVISGYSGGHKDYPAYKDVGYGTTGHTEAIYIYYDKTKIDYKTLLEVFFVAHDPTTLNRQGPDVGEAYRSAIYYNSDSELKLIESAVEKVNTSGKYNGKVVTEIGPYKEFWVAESYHQNFYELNPNQGYVSAVSRPKVEKVVKAFPELVKKKYKK